MIKIKRYDFSVLSISVSVASSYSLIKKKEKALLKWKCQLMKSNERHLSNTEMSSAPALRASPGRRGGRDGDAFKCAPRRCWWEYKRKSLPASRCYIKAVSIYLFLSTSAGHRDHQHGHSDGTHRGHSCQNGLHRDERGRHGRLSLRAVQVF